MTTLTANQIEIRIETMHADEIEQMLETMSRDSNFAYSRVLQDGENSGQWHDWNWNSEEYGACLMAMRVRDLMGSQARNN